MSWNEKTNCNDYIEALEDLIDVLTSDNVATAVIVAGGTNFEVGEILDIDATGAVSTSVAQVEVTAETGGIIDTIRVYRSGAYTTDPTNLTPNTLSTTGFLADGTAAAGPAGAGATATLVMETIGWTVLSRRRVAITAAIGNGGTGYTGADVVTVQGGILWPGGSAATFTVDSVTGGVIDSVTLASAGDYEVIPANDVQVTGGTGNDDAELTVTWTDSTGVENAVVLQGNAGAETDPIVGIFLYSDRLDATGVSTIYNWAVFGMTAWSDQFSMYDQANITPGFELSPQSLAVDTINGGCFLPLKNSGTDLEWAISVTGRRVVMSFLVDTPADTEAQVSFGLYSPFGTANELPYPAYIAGTTDRPNARYDDSTSEWGGISQIMSRSLNGPTFAWTLESGWVPLNAASLSTDITPTIAYGQGSNGTAPAVRAWLWPVGTGAEIAGNDQIWNTSSTTFNFSTDQLVLAVSPTQIYPTPGSGGTAPPLYPLTAGQTQSTGSLFRLFGEVDGVFWFSLADTGLTSRDRIIFGATRYKVFQNGTRSDVWSYMAVRED